MTSRASTVPRRLAGTYIIPNQHAYHDRRHRRHRLTLIGDAGAFCCTLLASMSALCDREGERNHERTHQIKEATKRMPLSIAEVVPKSDRDITGRGTCFVEGRFEDGREARVLWMEEISTGSWCWCLRHRQAPLLSRAARDRWKTPHSQSHLIEQLLFKDCMHQTEHFWLLKSMGLMWV